MSETERRLWTEYLRREADRTDRLRRRLRAVGLDAVADQAIRRWRAHPPR